MHCQSLLHLISYQDGVIASGSVLMESQIQITYSRRLVIHLACRRVAEVAFSSQINKTSTRSQVVCLKDSSDAT